MCPIYTRFGSHCKYTIVNTFQISEIALGLMQRALLCGTYYSFLLLFGLMQRALLKDYH